MKKIIIISIVTIMLVGMFAGCNNSDTQTKQPSQTEQQNTPAATAQETAPSETQAEETSDTQESQTEETSDTQESQDANYAFEFEDVDGNVRKLSDYQGKPVYLRVWGSWCGVCMQTLEDFNTFAGEAHDYEVISVVFPGVYGEKTKDDFIPWFEELGYDNLTVLLDEDSQLVRDFGISTFPSEIYFDADGNFVTGNVGKSPNENIDAQMSEIANE